jgi:hypothetical protein
MATNKRDLKAYVRFDGTGRIIPGSLVLRRNKPKNGNWKETQAYECCDGSGCVGLYALALNFDGPPAVLRRAYYSDRDLQNIPGQCADSSLAIGAKLYLDPQGTIIAPDGSYYSLIFQDDSLIYGVTNGIIVSASCAA